MSVTLFSREDVQKMLGISDSTMFRILSNKQIHGFKVGREWRFTEKDVQDFIDKQRQSESPTNETAAATN